MRLPRIIVIAISVFVCYGTAFSQLGWERQISTTDYTLHSVDFVNDLVGTVSGDTRIILRTTDSGQNWNLQSVTPFASFYGVSFCDSLNGVATGSNGAIVNTTNGGSYWNTVQDGWMINFYSAFQLDSLWACVAGVNTIFQPLIVITPDGWQTQNVYNFYLQHNGSHEGTLRDVHFFNNFEGIAAAAVWNGDGAIVRTTNGGASWATAYWGSNYLTAVDFPTPETGYAVGFDGTILHSADSGYSWTLLTVGLGVELLDVSFGAADTGTAVGAFGYILRTVDGGQNWSVQDGGTTAHLRGVAFVNSDIGWAVGDSGIILFTYTGGEPPGGCDYTPGDANNSGATDGLDVIYLVAFFKGGAAPPLTCPCGEHGEIYVAADVNGSCSVNGLDVTYMVAYFKGGPALFPCPDCPPTP
jgi:photosystem II stability/assembly factor-like uncharacterized protein